MIPAIRYDNPKMLTEKHNDEKLVITLLIGRGIDYISFLVEKKMESLLFIIGGALVNAFAFSNTNSIVSRFTDHGEKERKRHDLAEEKTQGA